MHIKKKSSSDESVTQLNLSTYDNFEWDKLYVIEGPRFPEEVNEIVGLDSFDKGIPDDARLCVFLHGDELVSQSVSYCHDLNYSVMGREGYVKYHYEDIIKVRSRETEDNLMGGDNEFVQQTMASLQTLSDALDELGEGNYVKDLARRSDDFVDLTIYQGTGLNDNGFVPDNSLPNSNGDPYLQGSRVTWNPNSGNIGKDGMVTRFDKLL